MGARKRWTTRGPSPSGSSRRSTHRSVVALPTTGRRDARAAWGVRPGLGPPRRGRESAAQRRLRLGLLPSGPDPVHALRLPPAPTVDTAATCPRARGHDRTNWRRGWDSNPRSREGQRFSRPPQSTTLSPLRTMDQRPVGSRTRRPLQPRRQQGLLASVHGQNEDPIGHFVLRSLAEREGFEPSERFNPLTRFPSEHNRPLCHLSAPIARSPPLPRKASRAY